MTDLTTRQSPGSGWPRFAAAKFRPPVLPVTMVARSALQDRLTAGAPRLLTLVVGPAGSGKTVLLASWAAARSPSPTAWLSCDAADAQPVRFWYGFIQAVRAIAPDFGTDAVELLAMGEDPSADLTASLANDVERLPAEAAIIVRDFHCAGPALAPSMTDLIARWPADAAQLVLACRFDPVLRLHRLRMSGELCELRESDLAFSLTESRDLLANFEVAVDDKDLAGLHERTEGWAAALQMAALALRATTDPRGKARALDLRSHTLADYFVSEVLDQQPDELAHFMLDISVLAELTPGACAAVSGRHDAGVRLRDLHAAGLFLVSLDEQRTCFRYHHLVRQLLRAELRVRDPDREQVLHMRAAGWLESAGDVRRAAQHLLEANQVDRALTLLEDQITAGFMHDPQRQPAIDLSTIDLKSLASAPGRLLALATYLLMSGDVDRGGRLLELVDKAEPPIPPGSRLSARHATVRSLRHMLLGQAGHCIAAGLTAREIEGEAVITDPWVGTVPLVLLRPYSWLEDYHAVEREAGEALSMSDLTEPVELVLIPGAIAAARYEAGQLADAATDAEAADKEAHRLGLEQHFIALDYLRALAGLALERRDLDAAEAYAERALSVSEQGRPAMEFLALLERAQIWAARGQVHEALATVEGARKVLAGTGSELLTRADELEAALRLSLGDLRSPAELAGRLPPQRRCLLRARIAVAGQDPAAARHDLQDASLQNLTPRRALIRQILLAAAAATSGDPLTARVVADVVEVARRHGYCHTVLSTAPELTTYLVEHSTQVRPDPFIEQLISASLEVRAARPDAARSACQLAEPLTEAEMRVLKLLPTSTYLQMSQALYISRNTVKTHLRSIYHKLLVRSRSEAIERAVDLRLL